MKRDDYRRLLDSIEPDAGLESRLAQQLLHQKPNQIRRKQALTIVASLLFVIIVGLAGLEIGKRVNQSPEDSVAPIEQADPVGDPSTINPAPTEHTNPSSVIIPKIKLPKSNANADMIGLVVYKGNIYTQTNTSITPEVAEQLLGDKLGRTKAGIDEWSEQADYVELASNIGVTDIFSVKGYDSEFRIMSYLVHEGQIYAELYEQLNGITITKGEDLIGKLQLKDHVESVSWQDHDSWYYSKPQLNQLPMDQAFPTFLDALYEAKPIDADKLYKEGIYNNGAQNQKVLYLKLQDQTEVRLVLFKGNYVKYAGAHVFFQLEPDTFSALWDQM